MPDLMTDPNTTAGVPDDSPVIPSQPAPPDNITAPDMGQGGVPQTGQPTSPDVSQMDPKMLALHAAAVHHGRVARAINAVGSILGGDTTYHITTNPDGSVDATPQASTPGEKWGRIAKAALMGAAKGFEVGQGPGGAQRAAAAGIETGMAMPQAQQDQTMALADKMNNQNQQRLMFNANMAYLNTRNLEASWALGNNKKVAAEHDEDRDLQFNQAKTQLHMIDVGPADNVEQAATIYNGNQQVQQALVGKGGQLIIHHPASGPPHAYIIPEDQLQKLNPKEQTGYTYSVDPKTYDIVKTPTTVAANTETGQGTTARLATEQAGLLKAIQVSTTAKKAAADAAEAQSKANAPPKQEGTWRAGTDANGNPIMMNDKTTEIRPMSQAFLPSGAFDRAARMQQNQTFKNYRAASKDYIQPAEQAEQSYQLANNAYNDYLTAKKQGKTLPTGAQSMLLLAQHMGTTFGAIKGGPRQTAAMIAQHLGARSVSDDAAVAWNKLVNGDELSPKQWTAFHDLIANARREKWASAVQQVPHYGVDPNDMSLPTDLNDLLTNAPAVPNTSQAARQPATGIPTPIAPARPGGANRITHNGQSGTVDANGMFTPDGGGTPIKVPGFLGTGTVTTPSRSIGAAMRLPVNAGKTAQQVEQDLRNHGYNPVP